MDLLQLIKPVRSKEIDEIRKFRKELLMQEIRALSNRYRHCASNGFFSDLQLLRKEIDSKLLDLQTLEEEKVLAQEEQA